MPESEPELPPRFEDAIRAALASMVAAGPQPDDAHLDALEGGAAPVAAGPRRSRRRAVLAVAAVILAIGGIAAVVVRAGDRNQRVGTGDRAHPCAGPAAPTLQLTTAYRDEPRRLVPLLTVYPQLGFGGPPGQPTTVPGDGTAELRYPGGEVIGFSTAPGTAEEAAPSPFPTTRAEAEDDTTATKVTSGMTATGLVTTVETPVAIRRSYLEGMARDAAELPETMATAAVAGKEFPVMRQSFELDGHGFDRSVEFTDGIVHVSTDVTTPVGDGGLPGSGGELSMLVGAVRPQAVVELSADGHYQWLVFVPAGLEVELDTATGDRCAASIRDALTGGEYWLVRDGDGDEEATMTVTTTGRPDEVTLTRYVG